MNKIQLELDIDNLDVIREDPYKREDNFTVMYGPTEKGRIIPSGSFDSCREIICDHIRTDLDSNKKLDIKKTRLLIYTKFIPQPGTFGLTKVQKNQIAGFKSEHEKGILIGLKVLNLFEKKSKWPLTKIYSVRCDQVDENHVFYYFMGSKKWIKSPSLFSLFMLLIRVGKSIKKRRMFRTLDGFYKSLYENKKTTDVSYMRAHYERCLLVMKYYNRLFSKTSMHDLYIPCTNKNFFIEGINTLCDLITKDPKLLKKFSSVLEREKKLEHWEK